MRLSCYYKSLIVVTDYHVKIMVMSLTVHQMLQSLCVALLILLMVALLLSYVLTTRGIMAEEVIRL